MTRGLFIAIEGPDGAGKTTLLAGLASRLKGEGIEHVSVREPGGTPAAEYARQGAFDPTLEASPLAELFFFLAARADLVAKVINPALQNGSIVLSDRFELSTYAYQVKGRGLPADAVLAANALATGGLKPDLTLILDLTMEQARARRSERGGELDRLELESSEFHVRVMEAFRAAEGPGLHHIDAGNPPEVVEDQAWRQLVELLDGTIAGSAGST